MCGEKWRKGKVMYGKRGSPPRVRGKELCLHFAVHAIGITPACAGKRVWLAAYITSARDHPRVCGEKVT